MSTSSVPCSTLRKFEVQHWAWLGVHANCSMLMELILPHYFQGTEGKLNKIEH